MAFRLSRRGDRNQAGGRIIRHAPTVVCNGIPVGIHVSPITPHGPGRHGGALTTTASPDVYAEGFPVLRVTSGNDCGHSIIEGSKDTIVT